MNTKFIDKPFVAPAIVLAVALILSFVFMASAVKNIKATENAITVTGSAKERVQSDIGKVYGSYERQIARDLLSLGYKRIGEDKASIEKIFTDIGVTKEELSIAPVSSYEVFDYNYQGVKIEGSGRMVLTQSFTVSSSDLEKIKKVSESGEAISGKGIFIQLQAPQYLYSKEKLAELRVTLLGKAVEDAKARADVIAKGAGSRVSKIESASSGVVQLLAPDSVNVEDYGSYDTTTVEKDVMVTVKAQFKLR